MHCCVRITIWIFSVFESTKEHVSFKGRNTFDFKLRTLTNLTKKAAKCGKMYPNFYYYQETTTNFLAPISSLNNRSSSYVSLLVLSLFIIISCTSFNSNFKHSTHVSMHAWNVNDIQNVITPLTFLLIFIAHNLFQFSVQFSPTFFHQIITQKWWRSQTTMTDNQIASSCIQWINNL